MDGSTKEKNKQVSLRVGYISMTDIIDQTSNPIYHFYRVLSSAPQGTKAEEGDRFYQSYHGAKKIMRVTRKIRNNLNGMVFSP